MPASSPSSSYRSYLRLTANWFLTKSIVGIGTPPLLMGKPRLNKFSSLSSSDRKATKLWIWKTVTMTGHAVKWHWGMSRHWRQERRSWQKSLHLRCQSHRVKAWGGWRRQYICPASKPASLDTYVLPFVWQTIETKAPNNSNLPCKEMGNAEALASGRG